MYVLIHGWQVNAYPSGALEFTSGFSSVCIAQFKFSEWCFVDYFFFPFFFGCLSILDFRLPFWYLQTFLSAYSQYYEILLQIA